MASSRLWTSLPFSLNPEPYLLGGRAPLLTHINLEEKLSSRVAHGAVRDALVSRVTARRELHPA